MIPKVQSGGSKGSIRWFQWFSQATSKVPLFSFAVQSYNFSADFTTICTEINSSAAGKMIFHLEEQSSPPRRTKSVTQRNRIRHPKEQNPSSQGTKSDTPDDKIRRRKEQNFFSGSEIYFQGSEIYFQGFEINFQATEKVLLPAARKLFPAASAFVCVGR